MTSASAWAYGKHRGGSVNCCIPNHILVLLLLVHTVAAFTKYILLHAVIGTYYFICHCGFCCCTGSSHSTVKVLSLVCALSSSCARSSTVQRMVGQNRQKSTVACQMCKNVVGHPDTLGILHLIYYVLEYTGILSSIVLRVSERIKCQCQHINFLNTISCKKVGQQSQLLNHQYSPLSWSWTNFLFLVPFCHLQ